MEGPSPLARDWAWRGSLISLAVGTLILAVRLGGTSPLWSSDTINDEKFVRTCLEQDGCYWFGMGTSVEWVVHGANFLHLKTLLRAIGASDALLHWVLHVSLSLAVVFTALAGYRLAGRMTGVLGAVLVPPLLLATDLHMDVTYNHRLLPLLASLVLVLVVRAVMRGWMRDLVLAGGLAGIATNIHMECAPFAAAVPFAAAWMPRARLKTFLMTALSVTATAFLTSPDAWLHNASALLRREMSPPLSSPARTVSTLGIAALIALFAVGALALARPRRFPRTWLLLPLLAAPKVAATEAAALLGFIEPEAKYAIEIVPVIALALALVVQASLALAGASWTGSERFLDRLCSSRTFLILALLAPGAVVASWPIPGGRGPMSERALTMLSDREFRALRSYLTRDLGWSQIAILRGLRGPLAFDALDLLVNLDPRGWRPEETRQAIVFAKVPTDALPDSLPPGFRLLTSGDGTSLVVEVLDSWLDMARFRVCTAPRSTPDVPWSCRDTGIAGEPWPPGQAPTTIPGMPPVRRGQDITLRIGFTIHFPPVHAGEREVFMPPLRHGCAGRISEARGGRSGIVDGGRGALLVWDGSEEGAVTLEWRLGTRECGDWTYRGFVPFFIEGEPASIRAWKTLLAPLLAPGHSSDGDSGGHP